MLLRRQRDANVAKDTMILHTSDAELTQSGEEELDGKKTKEKQTSEELELELRELAEQFLAEEIIGSNTEELTGTPSSATAAGLQATQELFLQQDGAKHSADELSEKVRRGARITY